MQHAVIQATSIRTEWLIESVWKPPIFSMSQAMTQRLPCPPEPPLDRPHRASQPRRGLLVGHSFEVAKHQWCSIFLGQEANLLA
jgi:hypothetical protein